MSRDLLLTCLRQPERLACLSLPDWECLIRQARAAILLGTLHRILELRGELHQVPPQALRHLSAERNIIDNQHRALRMEVRHLRDALGGLGFDVVLLKGAAYVLAGLPHGVARRFMDVDILVPHARLAEVEAQLMLHGWHTAHSDPYDQRYYRLWMHELPAMQHGKRGTVVDVHHALLPLSGRLHPSSAKLLEAARPLPALPGLSVLAPLDMILHSACHLFQDGELNHGLRDLMDLHGMLQHFAQDQDFWPALMARAVELDLQRPLFYALRYLEKLLELAPAPSISAALAQAAPSPAVLSIMDALYLRALRPHHPSAADRWTRLARLGVYVRAHWQRMPPHLLAYHLARKAILKPSGDQSV